MPVRSRSTPRRRRWASGVIAAGLAAVLVGCSGAGQAAPTRAASPRASATATPTPTPDPITAFAEARLARMTLQQKVASLFVLHQPGTDGAALGAYTSTHGLGGMILMGDNIPPTPEALVSQTAAMSAGDPDLRPLIAIDEEGGDVTRLPWDALPGADTLRGQEPAAATAAFRQRAALLKQGGVNVNFGIVADVTADPASFIADRVLGGDPASAAQRVAAAVAGERGAVGSTLKHFPGHGETDADSHLTVPTTPLGHDEWAARDAGPFRAGVEAGAELVMFGHLVYSGVDAAPASLSPAWHRILRQELGFRGVTITDDLRMLEDTGLPEYQNPGENAVRAIAAGNDIVLDVLPAGADPATLIDPVVAAVQQGRIPAAQVDESALRVLQLRRSLTVEE